MSNETRLALVAKLAFTDDVQKLDLLDETTTSTWLIAMLDDLTTRCTEPIMITAVRTDHKTPDGPWAHSGGLAVDMYPKNWQGREQEAVCNVLKALSLNPYAWAIGLGGKTQQWQSYVTWPTENFIVFQDNNADHIHAGAAQNGGGPGNRLETT